MVVGAYSLLTPKSRYTVNDGNRLDIVVEIKPQNGCKYMLYSHARMAFDSGTTKSTQIGDVGPLLDRSTGNVSNGVTQFFLVAVVCAWQDDGGEGGVEGGTGPGPEARDGVPGAGDRAGFPPAQLHPLHCLPQRSLSLCLLSVFASNQHCPRSTDKLLFL